VRPADLDDRRARFRKLHEQGCFVIPNPWDAGTARYLHHLGFQALATTSSGFAFSHGLPDSSQAVPREMVLGHFAAIVDATPLPVNADFQAGYGDDPAGVAESVALCVGSGVAGLSIEDSTGDGTRPLYEMPVALERLRAAREAIDASSRDVLLTARAECYLVGHPNPLEESIRRLRSYAEAGADVLYAPGVRKPEEIRAMVAAVAPRPLNVLMGSHSGLRVGDLAEMGVRRISVGSALSRAAWTGFIRAAKAMAEDGSFEGLDGLVPYADLNRFFEGR
jgi:2-methylisocitrate lyase-like PEP mutase family enzyme